MMLEEIIVSLLPSEQLPLFFPSFSSLPPHSHCLLCYIEWMLFSLLHPTPAAGALFREAG